MVLDSEIETLIEYNNTRDISKEFLFLCELNKEYYIKQLDKINSNIINNFAKCLISKYHYDYYKAFNELIEYNENREEYDYYNIKFLDVYLDNVENNIEIDNGYKLNILKSIIKLSQIFLENALNNRDFELLLNSFFQLKDKLESNDFFKDFNQKITTAYIDEDNLFEDNDSILLNVGVSYVD